MTPRSNPNQPEILATTQHYNDLRLCADALQKAGHHENAMFLMKHLDMLQAADASLCKKK